MKKILKSALVILMVSLIAFSFSTCKKDTECEAVVTVKLQSDTTVIVTDAIVQLKKADVFVEGVSDASGQFRHTFKLEAILDVYAEKPGTPPDTLYGQTVIRLKPGESVSKTVFIQ